MHQPIVSDCFAPFGAGEDCVLNQGGATLRFLNPFDGVFLTVGDYRKGGEPVFRMMGRGMVTMLFSLLGQTVVVDQNGREWTIPANTFGFLYRAEGTLYEIKLCEDSDVLTLGMHITVDALSREPFRRGLGSYYTDIIGALDPDHCLIATVAMNPSLRLLALSSALCWRDPETARPLEAAIRTLELVDGIAQLAASGETAITWFNPSRTDVERLVAVKHLIDNRFNQNLTLADLANHAAMSETRLKTGFRELFGVPPMAYLYQVRISRAKELLRGSEASIGQIAWAVGYTHQCNFTVAFKRGTGRSPKSFRRLGELVH